MKTQQQGSCFSLPRLRLSTLWYLLASSGTRCWGFRGVWALAVQSRHRVLPSLTQTQNLLLSHPVLGWRRGEEGRGCVAVLCVPFSTADTHRRVSFLTWSCLLVQPLTPSTCLLSVCHLCWAGRVSVSWHSAAERNPLVPSALQLFITNELIIWAIPFR